MPGLWSQASHNCLLIAQLPLSPWVLLLPGVVVVEVGVVDVDVLPQVVDVVDALGLLLLESVPGLASLQFVLSQS
jgi:hypothetical protein